MKKYIDSEIVILNNQKYLVYLKEVATKIAKGGKPEATTIRAFVKKMRRGKKHNKAE